MPFHSAVCICEFVDVISNPYRHLFSLFTENLFPCPASELIPITHWEVGKYFCTFVGNKYVPNVALKQIYEQDIIK